MTPQRMPVLGLSLVCILLLSACSSSNPQATSTEEPLYEIPSETEILNSDDPEAAARDAAKKILSNARREANQLTFNAKKEARELLQQAHNEARESRYQANQLERESKYQASQRERESKYQASQRERESKYRASQREREAHYNAQQIKRQSAAEALQRYRESTAEARKITNEAKQRAREIEQHSQDALNDIQDHLSTNERDIINDAVDIATDLHDGPTDTVKRSLERMTLEMRNQLAKDKLAEAKRLLAKVKTAADLSEAQRRQLREQARIILESGVLALRYSIRHSLEDTNAPGDGQVIRVGVNSLGGYAATSSYVWLYSLRTSGYKVERVVGTGLELTHLLNTGVIDITFEALPDRVDGEVLGTWADHSVWPMRISGRKGFTETFPVLADRLHSYQLDTEQIESLVPSVQTRGVAPERSQDAAVEIWLLEHPEVITGFEDR